MIVLDEMFLVEDHVHVTEVSSEEAAEGELGEEVGRERETFETEKEDLMEGEVIKGKGSGEEVCRMIDGNHVEEVEVCDEVIG